MIRSSIVCALMFLVAACIPAQFNKLVTPDKTVYAKFVGKHKEKFFGALGPNIKEDLVEHEKWGDFGDDVERYGLDSKVRTWKDLAANHFGVDLSPLSDEARERLKKGLRGVIDDLVNQLEKAGKSYKDVRVVIEDDREDVEDELK